MIDVTAPVFTVREVRLYEREVRLRMPFRFGVVTLTQAPQVFVRARIELPDGSSQWGAAAELLAPKWFDKNLALSNEDNFEQLRSALTFAIDAYTDPGAGPRTAFGHFAAHYEAQIAAGAACGLNPLVASFGPAQIDRAVLDACAAARAARSTRRCGSTCRASIPSCCRRSFPIWPASTCRASSRR